VNAWALNFFLFFLPEFFSDVLPGDWIKMFFQLIDYFYVHVYFYF